MVRRSAFTLIEVLIAMILISITVLSVPMIIQINAASAEESISQEAVFAASAKLLQTLSFPWDENATNAELAQEGADVLAGVVGVTPNGDTAASLGVTFFADRPGLVSRQTRRNGFGQEINASNIGDDNPSALVVGIDDFNGENSNVGNAVATAASTVDTAAGYKDAYTMTTTVAYVSDHLDSAGGAIDYNTPNPFPAGTDFVLSNAAVAGPTNLRMVSVAIFGRDKDGDGNPDMVSQLFGYAANIGETKPYRRRY